MEEKYIVFKWEEYHSFQMSLPDRYTDLEPERILDAVVIRKQDTFAAPALDAYSNAILTTAEGMSKILRYDSGEPLIEGSMVDRIDKRIKRLIQIADYFHQQAVESWLMKRKLPD